MKLAYKHLGDLYTSGAKRGEVDIAKDEKRAEEYYKLADIPAEGSARVTVYSKPKGEILVDGASTYQSTPGTVSVAPG